MILSNFLFHIVPPTQKININICGNWATIPIIFNKLIKINNYSTKCSSDLNQFNKYEHKFMIMQIEYTKMDQIRNLWYANLIY